MHRGLIKARGWGDDGLSVEDIERLEQTAEQISDTERRSMMAERDTTDRYLAAYLSDRVGAEFTGKVAGIAKFGLFVKLDETGADGLVPISTLGNEYFVFDRESGTLMGSDTGRIISLGLRARVKLKEAAPLTGGIAFELLELDGEEYESSTGGRSRGFGRSKRFGGKPSKTGAKRKAAVAKKKDAAIKRKVTRQRKAKR